jgi:hypothetical protein
MHILTQLTLLAGLVAGSALLWMVSRAFRKHVAWGLAVLFLFPVAAVIFGIRHWREEKGPFLVYVTAFTAAMVLAYVDFVAQGGWDILRAALLIPPQTSQAAAGGDTHTSFLQASLNTVRERLAPERDRAPVAPLPPEPASVPPAATDPAPEADTRAVPEQRKPTVKSAKSTVLGVHYRVTYVPIDPADANAYVGMTVKVKRSNRVEQDCVLRRVSPTALRFEQHLRGGTFSFTYRANDIESLRVLVKQAD